MEQTIVNDIKNIFSFFFKVGFRSKRSRLFLLISFIPAIIFIIIHLVQALNPDLPPPPFNLFNRIGGFFSFFLFTPLLSLFFGTSTINDEVENRTLIYLTSSPVPKSAIILGKYLANTALTMIISISGMVVSYAVANYRDLFAASSLRHLSYFFLALVLSAVAYSALFTFLGVIMKRAIVLGLFISYGWENIVQFIPGSTQRLTIIHYIKSLLPVSFDSGEKSFFTFQLQPSGAIESIITLLMIMTIFLGLSIFMFNRKEYTLSELV